MKKAIQILSILAVLIMVLTLVLEIGVVALQNVLIPALFDERARYFIVPVQSLIHMLVMVVATGTLCVFISNQKCGVVFEIIFLAIIAILCLAPTGLIGSVENALMGELLGYRAIAQRSLVITMISYVDFLYPIGYALSLVCCGMSIGRKRMLKSIEQ